MSKYIFIIAPLIWQHKQFLFSFESAMEVNRFKLKAIEGFVDRDSFDLINH